MRYSYIPESDAAHDAYDPYAVIREPFPAPFHTSREPVSRVLRTGEPRRFNESDLFVETPQPVVSLAGFARENSWKVRTQYSQGYMPHATTGRPGVLKDLIGVRFGAHPMTPRQAYAVYSRNASGGAWAWSSVMIWGPDLPPYRGCGISELKAYLLMCPTTDTVALGMWVRDLREIAANGADMQKRRDVARKEIRQLANESAGRMEQAGSWPGRVLTAVGLLGEMLERWSLVYGPDDVEKIIDTRTTTDREGMR